MRCETCDFLLDAGDNYCRSCGAAMRVATVPMVRGQSQPPALFRSTAAPLATGAAAVAATAILRWALTQAVRGILTADLRPRRDGSGKSRALARREPPAEMERPRGVRETVEVFWYRRTVRD